MVKIGEKLTFEDALIAFTEQSKPTLKEYKRHSFFTPDANKKHHKRAKKRHSSKNIGQQFYSHNPMSPK